MTAKRIIKHQFYCIDCDLFWASEDVESKCPKCGKEVIAKMCTTREEREKC